jgi:hypothetical protein
VKISHYNLGEEFEFSARMPEEFFVKAMQATRPLFITEDFMTRVSSMAPDEVVRQLMHDLHNETDPNQTSEVLRWHYLFMDFMNDFPRLMLMDQAREVAEAKPEPLAFTEPAL